MHKKNKVPRNNLDLVEVEKGLQTAGKPTEGVRNRFNGKRKGTSLEHLYKETVDEMEVENDTEEGKTARLERRADSKMREMSRSRSKGAKVDLTDNQKNMIRLKQKIQKEWKNKGISGESDRRISVKLPKHLYSGVRGIGKTDRR